MRPSFAATPLLLALIAGLRASPTEGQNVSINFARGPLVTILNVYQTLTGRHVVVSDELRRRPVWMNTNSQISLREAVKFIESRLGSYDIRPVERDSEFLMLGSEERVTTPASLVKQIAPDKKQKISKQPYAEADGLRGEKLKAKLQDITSEHHRAIGYGPTKEVLMAIDQDPANPNNVITLYERSSVPKANYLKGDPSLAWDREHVLPLSYGAADGRFAKSDLHNLFPSLKKVNSLRGSLYFDDSNFVAEKVPENAPLASYDTDSWEPPDEVKGDIARIVFYMDTRYDGSDSKHDIEIAEVADRKEGVFGNLLTLLEWNADDPVSDKEKQRNEEIWKLQGNRNPFVDRPEFAERIYNTWRLMLRRDRGWDNIDTPPPPKDRLYKLPPLQ